MKSSPYVTAAGPDHTAGLDVPEIVQRNLEGRSEGIAVVELETDAVIADVAQGAGQYATLPVGEKQRSTRRL
jgi:hypothetical protein